MKWRFLPLVLAGVFGASFVLNGCGGGNPTAPTSTQVENPAATGSPATTGTDPALNTSPSGVSVRILESTFADDRCTRLQLPEFRDVHQLIHEIETTNGSNGLIRLDGAYLYHSPTATCAAVDTDRSNGAKYTSGAKSLDRGTAGVTTYKFTVPAGACGTYQLDDHWNDAQRTMTIAKVINTGKNCPATSCSALDLRLTVTGEGRTRTVKVTFKGQGPGATVNVDFGDGKSDNLHNGESVTHTWPSGTFNLTASFKGSGFPEACTAKASVSNENGPPPPPPPPTCANYNPPAITGDIESIEHPTYMTFKKGTVAPGGGTFNPLLPADVQRPAPGQPDGSFTTVYTLPYGPANLGCHTEKSFTKPVPAKADSCANYNPPTITGQPHAETYPTEVVVTQGNVAPGGGTWNPSVPAHFPRPPYGSGGDTWHETYTVQYGPPALNCTKSKNFQGDVPPQQCQNQNEWTVTNERNDNVVYKIVIVTNPGNPAGSIVETFYLNSGESATFTGYNNQTLHAFFHLSNGQYHHADSASSGSCGGNGAQAQWEGDASLSVHCVCPN